MRNNRCIYLLSSNSSEDYMLDILKTMMLPKDYAFHFRYRVIWLSDKLNSQIPTLKNARCELRNCEILICYLYQTGSPRVWKAVYPIRKAFLVDVSKTGNSDRDVAFFYFKMGHFAVGTDGLEDHLRGLLNGNPEGSKYAFLDSGEFECAVNEESESAFLNTCESFDLEHFKSTDESKEYYPFFTSLVGLENKKGQTINPRYHEVSRNGYYAIRELSRYSFSFCTYMKRTNGLKRYSVDLACDDKIFSTNSEYSQTFSSPYDRESWLLIPRSTDSTNWSTLKFSSRPSEDISPKIPLNIDFDYYVKVQRRVLFRGVSVLEIIAAASITFILAFSKTVWKTWNLWWIPVLAIFLFWVLIRLAVAFWP